MTDHPLRGGFDEFRRFVNPGMYERASLSGEPIRIVATRDGRLVDSTGREFEDFHGTQAFGHRHPAIAAAVAEFLATDAPNWFPSRISPWSGRLARRLAERSGYERAWFGLTGSDAVEAAMKMARAATRRPRILGLERAYHGCTFGSVALMAAGPFRDPFGPHLPGVESLPFGDSTALARALEAGDVAAVIVEPIQGEGGVRPLPDAYVGDLCELTERHDVLLVSDEIQTGLGRSGVFLRSAAWPRRPEAALVAKQLAGGLLPVSAMLTTAAMHDRAYGGEFEAAESHNATFGYHALGAVASLAALDLLTDELLERVRAKGDAFRARLAGALAGNPLFREVRGAGLMVGIALEASDHPWLSFEHFGYPTFAERPSVGPLLCLRLYRHGYIAFACGHDWSVVRIQPRFEIPEATLDRFVADCREELDVLAAVG